MPTKPIASRISAYKKALANGEIQQTYQTLVGVVQGLRTDFAKTYGNDFAVAHILHGYIDVTYFYLQNAYLKKKKLKFAIVLNHQHVAFELWLLGQTKDVQIRYWESLKELDWVNRALSRTDRSKQSAYVQATSQPVTPEVGWKPTVDAMEPAKSPLLITVPLPALGRPRSVAFK